MAINTNIDVKVDFSDNKKSNFDNSTSLRDVVGDKYVGRIRDLTVEAVDLGTFTDDSGNNVNISVTNPTDELIETMQSTNDFEEARSLYGKVTKSAIDLGYYDNNSTVIFDGTNVEVIYSNEYLNTYLDEYLNSLTDEEKSFFIGAKGAELEAILRNAQTPREKVKAIAEFFAISFPKVRYGAEMHYKSNNNLFDSFNPDSLIASLCNGAPFDCSALVSVALASAGVNLRNYWAINGNKRSGSSLVADEIKLVDQKVSGVFSNYNLQAGDILTIERTNHVGIVMDVNQELGEAYILHSTGNGQVDGTSIIVMDVNSWKVKDFTNDYGKTGKDKYLNVGEVYFDNIAYLDSFL